METKEQRPSIGRLPQWNPITLTVVLGTDANEVRAVWGDVIMNRRRACSLASDRSDRAIWLSVGRRLRARRIQFGFDVDQVAEELGISQSEYEGYESACAQASAPLLSRLAELYAVPVRWFFEDSQSSEEGEDAACSSSRRTYRICTVEERVQFLAESFRQLDLEGQQHLLALARALRQSTKKAMHE
ncbi:MAG: helix-turn-helix transcriptional regulator [Hyphomicrobiaceae bacterium]|nr:MAG: helix-turn-helix transcriptional regulator [Hyphomicrobiaceae bacterium]